VTERAHHCDWVAYRLVSSIANFEQEHDALHSVGAESEPLSSFTSSSYILSRKGGSLMWKPLISPCVHKLRFADTWNQISRLIESPLTINCSTVFYLCQQLNLRYTIAEQAISSGHTYKSKEQNYTFACCFIRAWYFVACRKRWT
jgi:hypothetical protein